MVIEQRVHSAGRKYLLTARVLTVSDELFAA